MADPRTAIREHALRIGFDAIGFCRAELGHESRDRLESFLRAGYYGDMGWLADRTEQRSQPRSLWPGARSVIVVGINYAPPDDPLAVTRQKDRGADRRSPWWACT